MDKEEVEYRPEMGLSPADVAQCRNKVLESRRAKYQAAVYDLAALVVARVKRLKVLEPGKVLTLEMTFDTDPFGEARRPITIGATRLLKAAGWGDVRFIQHRGSFGGTCGDRWTIEVRLTVPAGFVDPMNEDN